MYRAGPSPLAHVLEAKLGPHGFATRDPDESLAQRGILKLFHRKTWNTNRGVVLGDPGQTPIADFVQRQRYEAGPFLGSSWWSQLGLQVVLAIEGAPLPSVEQLGSLVDAVNTQSILIHSVFALDASTGEWRQARTWGQVVTGKFQDAIAAAITEVVAARSGG